MYNGIKSLDHPVVAVGDMDSSREVYERLGFTVPPRGSHVEWGTGNWCIMFPDDYLELRGILDPERYTVNLDKVLERFGEGLMGIAFGTDSAQGNHEQLIKNGLQPKELKELGRNFELPGEWVQPRFSLCFPQEEDIIGLMHVVMCQHLTPELMRKPKYLEHANGVIGVVSMTGIIENVETAEAAQRKLLGDDAVERSGDNLYLTLPSGQQIHLLSKAVYQQQYGNLSKVEPVGESTYLGAVTLRVDNIEKVIAVLNNNNIPFEHGESGTVKVGAAHTCGVVIVFAS
jgi:Glyoxalase-like domain